MKKQAQALSLALALILSLIFSQASSAEGTETIASEGYTATQYPIVLTHGLVGFRSMLFGLVNYWGGLNRALERDGATVYVAQTSALSSSEARGELLIAEIETFLATTEHTKVNLWGHSQGALDIRYVATVRPDLIASITSIGGPHGTEFAGTFDASNAIFGDLITATAKIVHFFSGNKNPIDRTAGFHTFTAEGVAQFRANYPIGLPASACGEGAAVTTMTDDNGGSHDIYIYSWGGTSVWTTFVDPSDPLLAFISSNYPSGTVSDGIVTRCDSHLGDVISDSYKLNHFDLVNQVIGLVPFFSEKPAAIFRTHANRLKMQGL